MQMADDKPLYKALLAYAEQDVYPLHTPGHKGGRGLDEEFSLSLSSIGTVMDVSLMSELDDLHAPIGCLKEAQAAAAQLYGSDNCYFAVNGTTGAIHAMLLGTLRPGDKVLLPRNVHRSVVGALILGDLQAEFILPEYDDAWGFNTQVLTSKIEVALQADASIKAVLLTSPNYYGLAADVKQITDVVHRYDAILLIDEAHGAHLGFTSLLPPSALSCGADACAQSTHKTLGAFSQCSMLHIKNERINAERIAKTISLLTTTSPNYLLMASLDLARAQLAENGQGMAEGAMQAADLLRSELKQIAGLEVLDEQITSRKEVFAFDRTKVTVNVAQLGVTGIEAGKMLREEGIAVELVDRNNVLFLLTYADAIDEFVLIVRKIKMVFQRIQKQALRPLPNEQFMQLPAVQSKLSARVAFYSEVETVLLREAENRICGEQIAFYPPGIPVIIPGEIMTAEVLAYCQKMLALGIAVSGPADSTLTYIQVVK